MRETVLAVLLAAGVAVAACGSTAPPGTPRDPVPSSASASVPDSGPSGEFVLPPGDPEQGRLEFLSLQCNACHLVKGGGFPPPSVYPSLPFVLGERWTAPPSEAFLATSIIYPSHEELPGQVMAFHDSGEVYRMADYSHTMTVGQLRDIVAFLRTLAQREGVEAAEGRD